MTDLFENYTSPWMNDELTMLRDAARKFSQANLRLSKNAGRREVLSIATPGQKPELRALCSEKCL